MCIAVCYTLKFTPAEKKVVSELTIPFLSILKLPDKLIKGHPTRENIVNTLTMQTAHGLYYYCKSVLTNTGHSCNNTNLVQSLIPL